MRLVAIFFSPLLYFSFPSCAAMIISRTLHHLCKSRLSSRLVGRSLMYSSSASNFEKSYSFQGLGEGTKVQVTTNTGHSLNTDIPKRMGGMDSAPQPVETLVASWMGCTQATALFVARHLPERVSIQRIEFEDIQAFRDDRGALQLPIQNNPEIPSRLKRITGTIKVFSPKRLSSEQMKILKEQTEIRCPVANMMIASGCEMNVDWVDGTSTAGE